MNSYLRRALPVYVFILTVAGLMLIPSFANDAQAQCGVRICKVAPQLPVPQSPDDFFFFNFSASEGAEFESFAAPANALCPGISFSGNDVEFIEDSFPGWVLDNVECTQSPSISVTFSENGVSLDCLGSDIIDCTFTNVRGANSIPTLSEWGMITAAGGLALIGVFFALRKKKAQAV
jgi:hypothetical protein